MIMISFNAVLCSTIRIAKTALNSCKDAAMRSIHSYEKFSIYSVKCSQIFIWLDVGNSISVRFSLIPIRFPYNKCRTLWPIHDREHRVALKTNLSMISFSFMVLPFVELYITTAGCLKEAAAAAFSSWPCLVTNYVHIREKGSHSSTSKQGAALGLLRKTPSLYHHKEQENIRRDSR